MKSFFIHIPSRCNHFWQKRDKVITTIWLKNAKEVLFLQILNAVIEYRGRNFSTVKIKGISNQCEFERENLQEERKYLPLLLPRCYRRPNKHITEDLHAHPFLTNSIFYCRKCSVCTHFFQNFQSYLLKICCRKKCCPDS